MPSTISDTLILEFLKAGGPYLTVLVMIIAWQFISAWFKDKRMDNLMTALHTNTDAVNRLSTLMDVLTTLRGKR